MSTTERDERLGRLLADRLSGIAEPILTRDRQLAAIAAAHRSGQADRVDALIRDHLADYPDAELAGWLAGPVPTVTPTIGGEPV